MGDSPIPGDSPDKEGVTMALGNMGSDFNFMTAPVVATDTSSVPGNYVNTSVGGGANYNAAFSAGGSSVVWFLVIMAVAFVVYHMD
jgi:hypothetical protein